MDDYFIFSENIEIRILLRFINSCIGASIYELSKYLVFVLKYFVNEIEYFVKNVGCECWNELVVFFDVVLLFIFILIDMVIDII